jgi:hypothetical protein
MSETYSVRFDDLRPKTERAEMAAEAAARLVAEGKISPDNNVTDVTARTKLSKFKTIELTVE